jgi:hypothetical protein
MAYNKPAEYMYGWLYVCVYMHMGGWLFSFMLKNFRIPDLRLREVCTS